MHPPVLEDTCARSRTCAGERHSTVTTRNGSRLRNNASRIIVKREKIAAVYDIIPHRLRKLLLAVNSPRFLRPSLRSMYLHIVSVIHRPYSPRRVCVYVCVYI